MLFDIAKKTIFYFDILIDDSSNLGEKDNQVNNSSNVENLRKAQLKAEQELKIEARLGLPSDYM